MNSIILLIVCLAFCTVIQSATQHGGVNGKRRYPGILIISHKSALSKKLETSYRDFPTLNQQDRKINDPIETIELEQPSIVIELFRSENFSLGWGRQRKVNPERRDPSRQIIENNSKTAENEPSVNPELRQLNNSRAVLVESMRGLLIEIETFMSVANQSEKAKEIVHTRLEQEIWPQIIKLSESIEPFVLSHEGSVEEYKYQEDLMRIRAKIHLTAKMRLCESPFETFVPAKKRCIQFETGNSEGACPENQELLDGEGNLGVCTCREFESSIMNPEDKKCYQQFTRGPCKGEDHWWVLNDARDSGFCEEKPVNCPSDGKHVSWRPQSSDGIIPRKQCYKIGERGPCREGDKVWYDEYNMFQMIVECRPKLEGAVLAAYVSAPIARGKKSCPKNSPKCI